MRNENLNEKTLCQYLGVVVITVAIPSTKPELRFCADSNSAIMRMSDSGSGWKRHLSIHHTTRKIQNHVR